MKKVLAVLFLSLLSAIPASAAYHAVHIADDMTDPKTASYAFIGFYYDSLPIIDTRYPDKDNVPDVTFGPDGRATKVSLSATTHLVEKKDIEDKDKEREKD